MNDTMGQELKVGDFVAYAGKRGVRLGRIVKQETTIDRGRQVVRWFGERYYQSARRRWHDGRWELTGESYWHRSYRFLFSPSRALKLSVDQLPEGLADFVGLPKPVREVTVQTAEVPRY